ncbi:MAG: amidohydrolase family protein [Saccharolobus sp.]
MVYKERVELNVRLGLLGENLEIKENINIEIENGIITHIGNGFSSNGIDFYNGIIMPALVNSHVHAADFICKEMGYDKPIREVVGDPKSIKYDCLNSHTKEEISEAIEKFALRSKKLGSNIILDFREQGIVGSEIGNNARKKLREKGIIYLMLGRLEEDEFNQDNLKLLYDITDGYGLSSASTNSKIELVSKIFVDKIRAVHVSETQRQWLKNDLEYLITKYKPNLIIHGTHLSKDEFEILKEKNIPVVLCPRSNLWFSALPKVNNAFKTGITLLVGTDNGGILDPNIWHEMETLLLISRYQEPFSDYSLDILKAATINAYKFLGIKGWLEEGNYINALIVEGEESGIFNSNNKYLGIIKRGYDIIHSLGAIQNVI